MSRTATFVVDTEAFRALAWTVLALLLLVHGCGALVVAGRAPPDPLAGAESIPMSGDRDATYGTAGDCRWLATSLQAIRTGRTAAARYYEWVFSQVEAHTFHLLQAPEHPALQ